MRAMLSMYARLPQSRCPASSLRRRDFDAVALFRDAQLVVNFAHAGDGGDFVFHEVPGVALFDGAGERHFAILHRDFNEPRVDVPQSIDVAAYVAAYVAVAAR